MIRLRNPEYLGSLGQQPPDPPPEPNLVLWMDFTGADEGTTFVDRSVSANVVTPHGSAKTDNANYKSSPTSAYFLKSAKSYLSIPTGTWSNLALGDFTIELWAWPDGAYTESADVFGKTASATSFGPWRITQEANNWRWYAISAGGTDWVPAAGGMGGSFDPFSLGSINLNTWQHLAISRQGTSWKFFKNGSEINSAVRTLNLWNNSDDACVGRLTYKVDSYYFQGWVDDLKVYKGRAARWANFTP